MTRRQATLSECCEETFEERIMKKEFHPVRLDQPV